MGAADNNRAPARTVSSQEGQGRELGDTCGDGLRPSLAFLPTTSPSPQSCNQCSRVSGHSLAMSPRGRLTTCHANHVTRLAALPTTTTTCPSLH